MNTISKWKEVMTVSKKCVIKDISVISMNVKQ